MLKVSPTRQQLLQLKKRLKVARRGHVLLKEKRDSLIRDFIALLKEVAGRGTNLQQVLGRVMLHYFLAQGQNSPAQINAALTALRVKTELTAKTKSAMGVSYPTFQFKFEQDNLAILPYLAKTSVAFNSSVQELQRIFGELLKLAEQENALLLMASEIERTRRRVNALEHVIIPELQSGSRAVTAVLEERDRSSRAQLLKLKQQAALN